MSANKNDYVSEERLYLTKDGKVVGKDDPKRNELLVAKGGSLSEEVARKHGLVDAEGNKLEREADMGNKGENLESLTVPKLRDLAEQEEADLTGLTLKADIIKAIEDKRTAGPQAEDEEE